MTDRTSTHDDDEIQVTRRLLVLAQAGDSAALNDLYRRYGEKLRQVVRIRLGSRLRAKLESVDVVQEAFVSSLPHIKEAEFESDGAFLHWLSKIAENRIRDLADQFTSQKRDVGREVAPVIRTSMADSAPDHVSFAALGLTPSRQVSNLEETQLLESAIDRLPPVQKEALLLVRYEGLSLAEAGKHLDKSPDAVRMLIARAIVTLGKLIRER